MDYDLRAALYSKLSNDAPLNQVINGVYDGVQPSLAMPYITIGHIVITDGSDKVDNGFTASVQIDVWSDIQRGRKLVSQAAKLVYDALHRTDLVIQNYNHVDTNFSYMDIMIDPDGITYHAFVMFDIIYHAQGVY